MWAQLSSVRVKAGKGDVVGKAMEHLRTFEQPDSGLLRTIVMQDQKDSAHLFLGEHRSQPSPAQRSVTPIRSRIHASTSAS